MKKPAQNNKKNLPLTDSCNPIRDNRFHVCGGGEQKASEPHSHTIANKTLFPGRGAGALQPATSIAFFRSIFRTLFSIFAPPPRCVCVCVRTRSTRLTGTYCQLSVTVARKRRAGARSFFHTGFPPRCDGGWVRSESAFAA